MNVSRKNSKLVRIETVSDGELRAVTGGVSLTYGHIEWTYTKQKPDGAAEGTAPAK